MLEQNLVLKGEPLRCPLISGHRSNCNKFTSFEFSLNLISYFLLPGRLFEVYLNASPVPRFNPASRRWSNRLYKKTLLADSE